MTTNSESLTRLRKENLKLSVLFFTDEYCADLQLKGYKKQPVLCFFVSILVANLQVDILTCWYALTSDSMCTYEVFFKRTMEFLKTIYTDTNV